MTNNDNEGKDLEKKLKESENSYRRLSKNLPGIVYRVLIKEDNHMIFFNEMLQSMTGYTSEELTHGEVCSIESLIDPKDKGNVIRIVKDAVKQNNPFEVEYRFQHKDGSIKWFLERGRPIRDIDGNPVFIEGVIFDITERKKAEQKLKDSEEYLTTFINSAVDAFYLYDSELKLIKANNSALKMLHMERKDALGKHMLEISPNLKKTDRYDMYRKVIETGNSISLENIVSLPEFGNMYLNVKCFKAGDGLGMIVSDITERKNAEQKLKESEEKFRNLSNELEQRVIERTKELKKSEERLKKFMNSATEAFTLLDSNLNIIDNNEVAMKIFLSGVKKETIIGKNLADIAPDLKEKGRYDELMNVIKTGEPFYSDDATPHPKFGIRHVAFRAFKVGDGLGIITTDVSERKKSEVELQRYKLLVNSANAIILAHDDDWNVTIMNPYACKVLGYEEGEMIGKDIRPMIEKTEFERAEPVRQKVRIDPNMSQEGFEQYYWKKGEKEKVLISWNVTAVRDTEGNAIGIQAVGQNITESKRAEEKIEYQAKLVENVTEAILSFDMNYKILSWNKAAEKMYGWNAEEVIGKNFNEIIPVDFPNDNKEDVLREFSEKGQWSGEGIQHHRDGTPINILSASTIIKDKDGKNVGIVTINRDITERKKAEEELRLHSEIMKNMAEGVCLTRTDDSVFVYANPRFEKMFDYNPGELIGKHVSIINAPTDKSPEEAAKEILAILERTGEWHGEVNNIKKDGTPLLCYANISVFNHPEYGKVHVSVTADITERKIAEEKIKESEANYREAYERAEFYKDLFAHDISNILQNIRTSLGLLSMWQNKPEKINKISELMTIINDQLIRGSKLVSNIRRLSEISEAESHLEPVDGLQMLKDAKKFIRKSFPGKEINFELESQLDEAKVNANQLLLDVFENILFNGIKYNENKKIDFLSKISREIKNGTKYARFEFIDNGFGVPDVMKERIFKGISNRTEKIHGMGLGLLLVKRVLSIYNGDIWVEDKVQGDSSQGSNFIILIPEVV